MYEPFCRSVGEALVCGVPDMIVNDIIGAKHMYDKDPEKYTDAVRYHQLSFQEAYQKKLNIMDMTAFTLCQENKLPIIVFDMNKKGNLLKIVRGEEAGTLIS